MADDRVAAYLAEVRRDAYDEAAGLGPTRRAAKRDVPRLLAAVEAVLELTRDTDGHDLPGWSELPVVEFQVAISRALLGGE
jgi:hypothetical protein